MAEAERVGGIRRHVPQGRTLPIRFDAFLAADPPYTVEWNNLEDYGLNSSASAEVVPFVRLDDGGMMALWYYAASPAVIHIGGHGELDVLAQDFDSFLCGINSGRSGVADLDDGGVSFHVPGVTNSPKQDKLTKLRQRLRDWFARHTALQKPDSSRVGETLRARMVAIAVAMLRDGRSKIYKPESVWWSLDLRVTRTKDDLSIQYLDYGQWYPVPAAYGLAEAVTELLTLVKDKRRGAYDVKVASAGIVSVDRDRQLVLTPPGKASG